MRYFAIFLSKTEMGSLSRFRLATGVEVCVSGEGVWLRCSQEDHGQNVAWKALPGKHYAVLPDDQLILLGSRVPHGYLPSGEWEPLAAWMKLNLEPDIVSEGSIAQIHLKLKRGGKPHEANLLLSKLSDWGRYVVTAPQIRLDCLRFAANSNGDVMIRGNPLPPILGDRYFEEQGVAIELGWAFDPGLEHGVVRRALKLQDRDLAVFQGQGSWHILREDDFVKASRRALRTTISALSHGS